MTTTSPSPDTEFALRFEEPGGFAICRYEGPFTARNLIDAATRITAFCAERRYQNVLVDLRRSVGDLTVEERYVIANNVRYQTPASLRVAICIRPEQGDSRNTWTSVMTAHGFATRAFTEEEPAARWLLEPA